MHVFTYGTLMFPEVWRAVVGRDFATVAGSATAFAIYRVRDAVFPGIFAASDADSVCGVVYLDVDEASLARLDVFEDAFYVRQALSIACDDGQLRQANAYVVPAHNHAVLTDEPWDRDQFVASGWIGALHSPIRRFRSAQRRCANPMIRFHLKRENSEQSIRAVLSRSVTQRSVESRCICPISFGF